MIGVYGVVPAKVNIMSWCPDASAVGTGEHYATNDYIYYYDNVANQDQAMENSTVTQPQPYVVSTAAYEATTAYSTDFDDYDQPVSVRFNRTGTVLNFNESVDNPFDYIVGDLFIAGEGQLFKHFSRDIRFWDNVRKKMETFMSGYYLFVFIVGMLINFMVIFNKVMDDDEDFEEKTRLVQENLDPRNENPGGFLPGGQERSLGRGSQFHSDLIKSVSQQTVKSGTPSTRSQASAIRRKTDAFKHQGIAKKLEQSIFQQRHDARLRRLLRKNTLLTPLHTYVTCLTVGCIMMLMTLPAFALSLFMNNEWILGRTMCKLLPCLMDIGKLSAPIFVAAIALHQTYTQVYDPDMREDPRHRESSPDMDDDSTFSRSDYPRAISFIIAGALTVLSICLSLPNMLMNDLIAFKLLPDEKEHRTIDRCMKTPNDKVHLTISLIAQLFSCVIGILGTLIGIVMLDFTQFKLRTQSRLLTERRDKEEERVGKLLMESKEREEREVDMEIQCQKVKWMLLIFLLFWVPNLTTNMIYIGVHLLCYEPTIKFMKMLECVHGCTRAVFITYTVVNPLLVVNKDF